MEAIVMSASHNSDNPYWAGVDYGIRGHTHNTVFIDDDVIVEDNSNGYGNLKMTEI